MTRQEVALQIFLKRSLPSFVNDANMPGFLCAAAQSYEVADLFLAAAKMPKIGLALPNKPLPEDVL